MSEKNNNAPRQETACDLRDKISNATLTPREAVGAYLRRVGEVEAEIEAWKSFDLDFVENQLQELEQTPDDQRGPLFGVPVGIKDIFDTKDLPTGYGSSIYENHQPSGDCAVVARLRAAGAVIMGKTVSTEFAYWKAGPTRNPLNLKHTPGGSSSGSAAAVCAGMVPLAVGSQTAASTIRPASYCGIVGFKPSLGMISLAGVKGLAHSLDTAGVFGTCVADVGLIAGMLSGIDAMSSLSEPATPPVIAVLRAPEWQAADDEAIQAVTDSANRAQSAGSTVHQGDVPDTFAPLAEAQTRIMAREAARELAHERRSHEAELSGPLLELFEIADDISADTYLSDRKMRDACIANLDELFGDADVLFAPSTLTTAPLIEEGTGNPDLSRVWTMLGLPSITIPVALGESGLPLGLQIAARPDQDHTLLTTAKWLETLFDRST